MAWARRDSDRRAVARTRRNASQESKTKLLKPSFLVTSHRFYALPQWTARNEFSRREFSEGQTTFARVNKRLAAYKAKPYIRIRWHPTRRIRTVFVTNSSSGVDGRVGFFIPARPYFRTERPPWWGKNYWDIIADNLHKAGWSIARLSNRQRQLCS